ncbi:bactofilin family protein [Nitrospira sp. Kam-Ns4a]
MRNGNGQQASAVGDTRTAERRAFEASGLSPDRAIGDQVIAFVGKGVAFKGAIRYEGAVRIDGQVEGEIQTSGALIVGEDAVITAQITAGTVISRGKISGDVTASEKVVLQAPACLVGSVTAPLLSMQEGVLFSGRLTMPQLEELDRADRQGMERATPVCVGNGARPMAG